MSESFNFEVVRRYRMGVDKMPDNIVRVGKKKIVISKQASLDIGLNQYNKTVEVAYDEYNQAIRIQLTDPTRVNNYFKSCLVNGYWTLTRTKGMSKTLQGDYVSIGNGIYQLAK